MDIGDNGNNPGGSNRNPSAEDFDLPNTVRKLLADRQLDAEDALLAIIEGLMDNHMAVRRQMTGGAHQVSLIQFVEAALETEHRKNRARFERQAVDDEPDNTIYMSGLMFGQLADAQKTVSAILQECMKVVGARPHRAAA